jgi:sulfur carrier protein
MKVTINGEAGEIDAGMSLADLLVRRGQGTVVAVAVNGEFVPRSQHADRALQDGDKIEIVAPRQGG